jgi:hypothetical protein
MAVLKKYYPMSLAKMGAVFGLIGGLIAGLLISVLFSVFGGVLASFGAANLPNTGSLSLIALVVAIVGGAIFGFVFGFLSAVIYNFAASKVGGIRFDLVGKPSVMKNVVPMSYAKVNAVVFAIFGAIYGIILGLVTGSAVGAVIGIVIGIVAGVIGGFIIGFIGALLYNFLANAIGGIVLEIAGTPQTVKRVGAVSYAKIAACIEAIVYFIQGIFTGSILGIVIATVIGAVLGFVVGAICVLLYNFIASKIGGVQIDLS